MGVARGYQNLKKSNSVDRIPKVEAGLKKAKPAKKTKS